MFRAMTIPGGISNGRFWTCDRPTSCSESVSIDTSSAMLGRELVYVDLYIVSA